MATSVQRSRNLVASRPGRFTELAAREARRQRKSAKLAIERADYDALSRVQRRRSIAWEIC